MKTFFRKLGVKIDDVVIDSLFQPIVNRGYWHPADLSSSASIGASIMLATGCFWSALHSAGPLSVVSGGVGILNLSNLLLNRRHDSNVRRMIKPGFVNPWRELFRPVRLTVALASMVAVMLYELAGGSDDASMVTFPLGMGLSVASSFLLACACPPTKPLISRRASPNDLRPQTAAYRKVGP